MCVDVNFLLLSYYITPLTKKKSGDLECMVEKLSMVSELVSLFDALCVDMTGIKSCKLRAWVHMITIGRCQILLQFFFLFMV